MTSASQRCRVPFSAFAREHYTQYLTRVEKMFTDVAGNSDVAASPSPAPITASSQQKAVWALCLMVPPSKVVTYGTLARAFEDVTAVVPATNTTSIKAARKEGNIQTPKQIRSAKVPRFSRFVGSALGKNPFVPTVPCHRVVSADGKLNGYSAPGGLATKAQILTEEGVLFNSAAGPAPEKITVSDESIWN